MDVAEEGELVSDEEVSSINASVSETRPKGARPADGAYRERGADWTRATHRAFTRAPGLDSTSESDGISSDEDRLLLKMKRQRKTRYELPIESRSTNEAVSARSQPGGRTGSSNASARKTNNIWGSVIHEQALSQGIGGFGVDTKRMSDDEDRNVENYDYSKAFTDTRPYSCDRDRRPPGNDPFDDVISKDVESDRHVQQRMRRKRPLKERLTRRGYDEKKCRDHIRVKVTDPEDKVAAVIADTLKEDKVHLIERVVDAVGARKALQLLYLTEDVEAAGGMWTLDGSRRRFPGGVYLQLLKEDPDVTKDQISNVFAEERELFKKKCRARRSKQKQNKTVTDRVSGSPTDNIEGSTIDDDDFGTEVPDPLEITDQ